MRRALEKYCRGKNCTFTNICTTHTHNWWCVFKKETNIHEKQFRDRRNFACCLTHKNSSRTLVQICIVFSLSISAKILFSHFSTQTVKERKWLGFCECCVTERRGYKTGDVSNFMVYRWSIHLFISHTKSTEICTRKKTDYHEWIHFPLLIWFLVGAHWVVKAIRRKTFCIFPELTTSVSTAAVGILWSNFFFRWPLLNSSDGGFCWLTQYNFEQIPKWDGIFGVLVVKWISRVFLN